MKKIAVIFLIFLSISESSCYKKLYLESLDAKNILLRQRDSINAVNVKVKNKNIFLTSTNDTLAISNIALKTQQNKSKIENERLKDLENQEIITVKKSIIAYFDIITTTIAAYPAPCKNAANGHFRNRMTHPDIQALSAPQLNLQTKDAKELMASFKIFASYNQYAFVANPNFQPSNAEVIMSHKKDIVTFISDLYDMVTKGSSDDNKSYATAAKDVAEYSQNNQGTCHIGDHANGHISEGVRGAAIMGIKSLNSLSFATNSRAEKVAATIKICLLNIKDRLSTADHDPWLNANWENGYYFFLKAAELDLKNINDN